MLPIYRYMNHRKNNRFYNSFLSYSEVNQVKRDVQSFLQNLGTFKSMLPFAFFNHKHSIRNHLFLWHFSASLFINNGLIGCSVVWARPMGLCAGCNNRSGCTPGAIHVIFKTEMRLLNIKIYYDVWYISENLDKWFDNLRHDYSKLFGLRLNIVLVRYYSGYKNEMLDEEIP